MDGIFARFDPNAQATWDDTEFKTADGDSDSGVGHGLTIQHSGTYCNEITLRGIPLLYMLKEFFFVAHRVQFAIKIG